MDFVVDLLAFLTNTEECKCDGLFYKVNNPIQSCFPRCKLLELGEFFYSFFF